MSDKNVVDSWCPVWSMMTKKSDQQKKVTVWTVITRMDFEQCYVYLNISDCPVVIAVVLLSVYSTVLYQCTDRCSILLQYSECSTNSEPLLSHEDLVLSNKDVDSTLANLLLIPQNKKHNWSNDAFHLTAVCVNLLLFPWESVLMQVVFCCFLSRMLLTIFSAARHLHLQRVFLFFFNVARRVIIYFLGNMKCWNSRQRICFCCFVPVERWIQTFFPSAILLSAGLSLNETPHVAGIYFSVL